MSNFFKFYINFVFSFYIRKIVENYFWFCDFFSRKIHERFVEEQWLIVEFNDSESTVWEF